MSVFESFSTAGVASESILVTDGKTRAALATTRSLGRAGYAVHVVSESGRSVAGASRWCREEYSAPNANRDPEAWAARVETLARQLGASVLPMTELAIGSLFAAQSETRLDLIAPTRDDYEAAIDKHGLVERSHDIGIDVPASTLVERMGDLESLPSQFEFPVVAKPRRSRLLYEGRWHAPPVRILRDASAFREAAASWLPAHGDTLIQEFVPGRGEGLFAICDRGQVWARFAHQRLREKPPLGGVSVLRESIAVPPDVAQAGERLLASLGFSGIAMVEFRRSPDGRLVLMEINPRPWGSIQLAIDSGIDFPRLMLEEHRGRDVDAPVPLARVGVRTRWLLGDLDHWLTCARSRSLRQELDTSLGRIGLDFLRSFVDGSRLEVLKFRDFAPFRRELGQWIMHLLRR